MKSVYLILLFCAVIYSQTDSVESFKLPEMKLVRTDKKNTEIVFEEGYRVKVLQDSLLFTFNKINYSVAINNVQNIKLRDGTHFWKAAGISGAIGFGIGFLIGAIDQSGSSSSGHPNIHFDSSPGVRGLLFGFLLGIPFALIGGIGGLLVPDYDEYEIIKVSNDKKRAILLKAFRKNKE